jgi:hypothetical protein
LVSIGAPHLRSVGSLDADADPAPEHKPYLMLAREKNHGAHSAYTLCFAG